MTDQRDVRHDFSECPEEVRRILRTRQEESSKIIDRHFSAMRADLAARILPRWARYTITAAVALMVAYLLSR